MRMFYQNVFIPSSHKSLKTHPSTGGNLFWILEKLLVTRYKSKFPTFVFTSKKSSHCFICTNRTGSHTETDYWWEQACPLGRGLIDFPWDLGDLGRLLTSCDSPKTSFNKKLMLFVQPTIPDASECPQRRRAPHFESQPQVFTACLREKHTAETALNCWHHFYRHNYLMCPNPT